MTSQLESHTTTVVKPDMLSGVQTGNEIPYDEYYIYDTAHVRTYRKDYIFIQRRLAQSFTYILEWGQGTCTLYIDEARTALEYSNLQYLFFLKKTPDASGFKFSN